MGIAQKLHLDMAGADDHLLQIALAIAKRGLRLAAAFADFLNEFVFAQDWPHPAPATAPP